jgi:hypothetical protein
MQIFTRELVLLWYKMRVRFPALPDFLEIAGLERGPLRLVRTIEKLLE